MVGTIWEEILNAPEAPIINFGALQTLFEAPKSSKRILQGNALQQAKIGIRGKSKKNVLGTKSQNIQIVLSRLQSELKVDMHGVCEAVRTLQPGIEASEFWRRLNGIAPTKADISALNGYLRQPGSSLKDLDVAGQFLYTLHNHIFRVKERIECVHFMASFTELTEDAAGNLAPGHAAIAALGMPCVKQALAAALSVSNFIHASKGKQVLHGIQLSSLAAMASVRSSKDGQMTLMDFLVQQVSSEDPNSACKIRRVSASVAEALRVDYSAGKSRILSLSSCLKRLETEEKSLQRTKSQNEDGCGHMDDHGEDCLLDAFASFLPDAKVKVANLVRGIEELEANMQSLCVRFGSTLAGTSLKAAQEVFQGLHAFFKHYLAGAENLTQDEERRKKSHNKVSQRAKVPQKHKRILKENVENEKVQVELRGFEARILQRHTRRNHTQGSRVKGNAQVRGVLSSLSASREKRETRAGAIVIYQTPKPSNRLKEVSPDGKENTTEALLESFQLRQVNRIHQRQRTGEVKEACETASASTISSEPIHSSPGPRSPKGFKGIRI